MPKPIAFITGITGQDGSYLAEFLIERDYDVYGLIRRTTDPNHAWRLNNVLNHPNFFLLEGDVTDYNSVFNAVAHCRPSEVYNLAAQSFVGASFAGPLLQGMVNGLGAQNVMLAAFHVNPLIRFYQASTSEMFGVSPLPQSEGTPLRPRSPYGAAKTYAHHTARILRETRGAFIACGILFNHESPRRGAEFLSKKVCRQAAHYYATGNFSEKLQLGYTESKRDWGYAKEYVEAMWLMLQQDTAKDYVIATGESHAVWEWVEVAFASVGIDPSDLVEVREELIRPNEIAELCGDASQANRELVWYPKTSFEDLVKLMVEAELETLRSGKRTI